MLKTEEEKTDLAKRLIIKLRERGCCLATAESCTGGLIASAFVDVSGASDVFAGGAVTYIEDKKASVLGVSRDTLKKYTAVSYETAREMAEGAARLYGTQVAISSTGYAGPGGGTADDPVGTVYIGVYINGEIKTTRLSLEGDRNTIRNKAVTEGLKYLLSLL